MKGWRATWLVARREAKERARSRAFLASTAITLLLLAGVVAVIVITDSGPPTYDVAYVGESPAGLSEAVTAAAVASDALVETSSVTSRRAVADALENGELDAAIVDNDTILFGPDRDGALETILELALRQARLVERLEEAGLDPARAPDLFVDDGISIVTTGEEEDERSPGGEGIAVATIVLLFVVITTYGQWVLMGVLEEKSTRVVELVVSSTSVRSLLAGKVMGIGVLGIGQLVLIIAVSLIAGSVFDLFELPSSTVETAAWSLVWFVLGFAFYAALNAAAGSLVTRTEDAQAAATPIALIAVASYLLTFVVVMPDPDSPLAVGISLVPTVAPIAYPARVGFSGVPTWELLLGTGVMIIAVVAVVRLAARVYAGALLGGGSRVKIRDAWRAAGELTASR